MIEHGRYAIKNAVKNIGWEIFKLTECSKTSIGTYIAAYNLHMFICQTF